MLPYEHLEILLWFYDNKFIYNQVFFLIVLFNFSKVIALSPPEVLARPEIKLQKYQDVFDQIKKQNWVMAITLADDHNNKSLSSYVRWLDITRPGSNHNFDYLSNFFF